MTDDDFQYFKGTDEVAVSDSREPPVLAHSEDLFRLLVEGVQDYAIFAMDPEGRVASWNGGAQRIKGYAANEILGEHFSRFYTLEDVERNHPEQELRLAAAEGRYEEEGWRIRKDGSRFWASVLITALRDEEGTLRGFAKVTRDITERKLAEEERTRLLIREQKARKELEKTARTLENLQSVTEAALAHLSLDELLRELLSRIRTILDVDTVAVLLVTEDGQHLAVCAALGLQEEADNEVLIPIGRGVAGRIAEGREPVAIDDLTAVEVISPSLRAKRVQSLLGVPLLVEGTVTGVVHVGTLSRRQFMEEDKRLLQLVADRAALAIEHARLYEAERRARAELEQRVAERTTQLQEINTELESFTYTISHDLRAPLRAMQGFTEALLEDYADQLDEIGQDYARRIVASAQRMDMLIEDLLAYSRLSRSDLQFKRVSLASVVSHVLFQIEPQLQDQRADVSVEEPLPEVSAHQPILELAITNLLTNAIKFVESGVEPRVRIWAEENSGRVRLWVEDNGIGIAPDYQERIFHVFERLHGIETYPGTGVGLAIARRGIERMDGRVGVESSQGQGSRFWIELPKAESKCGE